MLHLYFLEAENYTFSILKYTFSILVISRLNHLFNVYFLLSRDISDIGNIPV